MNEQEAWDLYQANKGLIPRERVYSVVLAERSRLAKMAPEEALLKDEERQEAINKSYEDYSSRLPYLAGETEQGREKWATKFVAKEELAKVWPIAQARIEAEREKVLKEVLGEIEKHLTQLPKDRDESFEVTILGKYIKYRDGDIPFVRIEWADWWQALKSGKMPGERK